MDTGALTNASAKISSVKALRFTQWLICAPFKISRSPSVCRTSFQKWNCKKKKDEGRYSAKKKPKKKNKTKRENVCCVSKYSNQLVFHKEKH